MLSHTFHHLISHVLYTFSVNICNDIKFMGSLINCCMPWMNKLCVQNVSHFLIIGLMKVFVPTNNTKNDIEYNNVFIIINAWFCDHIERIILRYRAVYF